MKESTTTASKQLSLSCMLQVTPIWHTDTQLYFNLSGHTSIPGVIIQTGPHWLEKSNNKNRTNKSPGCRQSASVSILKAYCEMLPGTGRCHYLKEHAAAPGRVYTYPADATENMKKRFKVSMKAFPAGEKVQLALILVCTSRISGMLPNMVLISSCARIGPPSCPSFSKGTWNNWWIKRKKKLMLSQLPTLC